MAMCMMLDDEWLKAAAAFLKACLNQEGSREIRKAADKFMALNGVRNARRAYTVASASTGSVVDPW